MQRRQYCGTERRRQRVKDTLASIDGLRLNGIDFVEVLDLGVTPEALRQRLIDVTFIRADGIRDPSNPLLKEDNFRIEGGTRITEIVVTDVALGPGDRTLRLTVDRAGDYSTYALSVHAGLAAEEPPKNIDRALERVEFTFKADCPTSFDCEDPPHADPPPPYAPVLSYLAKDYDSFRQLMLDRMAETIPDWTDRSPADLGVTLVEAMAFAADRASYHQDAVATEAYLPLSRLRASVLRHARLLGYQTTEGANARCVVAITAAADKGPSDPPVIPAGTRLLTRPLGLRESIPIAVPPTPEAVDRIVNAGALVFESMEPVIRLREACNKMLFHTWGDAACCLPKGATVAHVAGTAAVLALEAGDLVALEETIPLGGSRDDPPNPAHRQVVRLVAAPVDLRDHVMAVDVVELRWGEEDALAFPLNLSGDGANPGAVARGNLVLVDHGRSVDFGQPLPEDADLAPRKPGTQEPQRTGLIADGALGARNRLRLEADSIVHARPFDARAAIGLPAVAALQPKGASIAQVRLRGDGATWSARADLLASDRFAPDFKIEPLEEGGGRVLFGDGTYGRVPDPDADFTAMIRLGGGSVGNIGADAIAHVVTSDPGIYTAVRNPIPAAGGANPEPQVAIKIAAPRAFRRQKRAVSAADYAAAAETFATVQRATAERRWTGSWHTMFLAIDRTEGRPVDAVFENDLRQHLAAQRLAGHDLEIVRPIYVPLEILLNVCVRNDHYPGDVERDLLGAFAAGFTRAGSLGFFHPDNLSFGQDVRLSTIIARAMAVQGVFWIGVRLDGDDRPGRFERMDQPGIDYTDAGAIPMGPKEIARLDNDPNAPDNGRMRFQIRGGR